MPINKNILFLLLILILLVLSACHNNAHIRTQKLLEPGQKSYSVSGNVNLGGYTEYGDISSTGIPGIRGEISMLQGVKNGEYGFYAGIGSADNDDNTYILGSEFKRYKNFRSYEPWKLGLQGELLFTDGNGSAVHLRPSFVSTTNRERPFYIGAHGIFSYSSQTHQVDWYEYTGTQWSNVNTDPGFYGIADYHVRSAGAGITFGVEPQSQSASFQLQVDASVLQNNYITDYYFPGGDNSVTTFIVSASAGVNIFKPASKPKPMSYPYPSPDDNIDHLFNPETGQPYKKPDNELMFDPETGEPVNKSTSTSFDPKTGLLLQGNESANDWLDVKNKAKIDANNNHNRTFQRGCGAAGCVLYPVGIPASLLYTELGLFSSFDERSVYYSELSYANKQIYKTEYKSEEKRLRRNSIYGTQVFCLGTLFFVSILGGM